MTTDIPHKLTVTLLAKIILLELDGQLPRSQQSTSEPHIPGQMNPIPTLTSYYFNLQMLQ